MSDGSHKHEELEGDQLAKAARNALTAAGEQWTPMRASVYQALASFTKPASAYDIAEAMSRADGCQAAQRIGFAASRPVIEVRGAVLQL